MQSDRPEAVDERSAVRVVQSGRIIARVVYAVRALRAYLADPKNVANVQVLAMVMNDHAAGVRRFLRARGGSELMRERPSIDARSLDLARLGGLPPGTLGRELAELMVRCDLRLETFPSPSDLLPAAQAFVYQRYRQTHDVMHVVLGEDTSPRGELAMQGFAFAQSGARSHAVLALAVSLRYLRFDRGLMAATLRGFVRGLRAPPLMAVRWEDFWEVPVVELRRRFGVER